MSLPDVTIVTPGKDFYWSVRSGEPSANAAIKAALSHAHSKTRAASQGVVECGASRRSTAFLGITRRQKQGYAVGGWCLVSFDLSLFDVTIVTSEKDFYWSVRSDEPSANSAIKAALSRTHSKTRAASQRVVECGASRRSTAFRGITSARSRPAPFAVVL